MPPVLEAVFGTLLVYIGVRFVIARRIPISDEGGTEVLAWISGRQAVALGLLVACSGCALLADACFAGGTWLTRMAGP